MDEEETNTERRNVTPEDPGGGGGSTASQPGSQITTMFGRQLSEAGRFAYAAMCAVSLARLFGGPEDRVFRERHLEGLVVSWLGLDGSVMAVMGAFLSGLGSEGSEGSEGSKGSEGSNAFPSILQAEPLLAAGGGVPIVQDLASFSVRDGRYDARARVLIRHVCRLLGVSPRCLEELEDTLVERLLSGGEEEQENEEESSRRLKKERGRRFRRYLLVGLAAVTGGTVIGVTGGLAAPMVAAGAAAVLGAGAGGAATAAAMGSAAGVATMASLFGAAGAGLTGYKMNNRVGAIEEFEILPLSCSSGKHLHLTIAVTGWLCSGHDSFQAPWSSLGEGCGERYCLVWESRFLRDLGAALRSLLDGLASMALQEALKYTVLAGVLAALAWPASLLAAAGIIDNPWSVCLARSAEAGKHLAHVLRGSRRQGRRPVSLVGFSLGARVIYFCLQELANDGRGGAGIVEDVVLLGAPVEGSKKAWERMSRVVAGRMVNGYCGADWLLGFLYRGSAQRMSVAGLQPVDVDDGKRVVNVDLSSVVKGHLDYVRHIDAILALVGMPTRGGGGVPGDSSSISGGLPLAVTITEGLLPQTVMSTEGKEVHIPDDECLEEQTVTEKQSSVECSSVGMFETCSGTHLGMGETGTHIGMGETGTHIGMGETGTHIGMGETGTHIGMGETGTHIGMGETGTHIGMGETGTHIGMGETGTHSDREQREVLEAEEGVSNGQDRHIPDVSDLLNDSLKDADESAEREASGGAEEETTTTSSWLSLFNYER